MRVPPRRHETGAAPSRLRSAQFPCRMRQAFTSEDRMKNYLDGGEAILEAFRKLKVEVSLKDLHVKHRAGYFAPS